MAKIQAFCGLDCGECEAYIATQKNDRAGLEATAKKWAEQFGAKDLSADMCICDGCSTRQKDEHGPLRDLRGQALRVCARGRDLRPLPGLRLRDAERFLHVRPRP